MPNLNNADIIIAPYAWYNGNGRTPSPTNDFPTAPSGAHQPCSLNNMGAGYGYVPPILNFDGVNDSMDCPLKPAFTNLSNDTYEFWVNPTASIASQYLAAQYDDLANRMFITVLNTGAVYIIVRSGGVTKQAGSIGGYVNFGVFNHIVIKKIDATYTIYVNGLEVTYAVRDTYDIGNVQFTDNTYWGNNRVNTAPLEGNFGWIAKYSRDMTDKEVSNNYKSGVSMGLTGNNVGTTMTLTLPFNNSSVSIHNANRI